MHQDFERYALQRAMNGQVGQPFAQFFLENVQPYLTPSSRILDYGCGDGKYFEFFSRHVPKDNIYGIEISKTRVDRCHSMGWRTVQQVGELQPLPFADSFFDLVNMDQVIEHIPRQNVLFYLGEIRRVLAGGGRVVVLTPNYPIKRIYDIYNAVRTRDIRRLRDDPTHVTRYGFSSLGALLTRVLPVECLKPTGGFMYERLGHRFFSHKIIALLRKEAE